MFKLQIVLVPPSLQNATTPFGFASSTAESSQLLGTAPLMGSGVQRNGDTTLPYPPSMTTANTSIFPSHISQVKWKKFLLFTKSSNSLLELSLEVIEKCGKMYPALDEEIDILSLQDSSGCDLDPDFLVKDVFNMDNTVRVILKNELNIDDSTPVSLYKSNRKGAKRQKLNNQLPEFQSQISEPSSSNNGGILKIAKKRTSTSGIRHPTNSNMRISTPLAHQIYPPPQDNRRAVSNNSEDEDAGEDIGERSFLPPPSQPQSPPIRISSGMGNNKRIKPAFEDDTVSRSETVDPDKSKQQRLLSGTPVRPTMTPNRVTLTGQRVISDRFSSNNNKSIFSVGSLPNNRSASSANTRITSGMLSIPEPKIAEVEKKLKEGPSSPASFLPAVPNRIPMKKPYQGVATSLSDDEYTSSDDQHADSQTKSSIQRQTSIADNNGSPVKDTSQNEVGLENIHLPELPKNNGTTVGPQRETSLEVKVQRKPPTTFTQNSGEDEPQRKESFSEEEDAVVDKEEEENDQEMESEIGIIDSKVTGEKNSMEEENAQMTELSQETKKKEKEKKGEELVEEEEEEEEGDDTVLINRNLSEKKPSPNTSIQKGDFVRYMEGDTAKTPSWYPKNHQQHGSPSKTKPYTTVLYNNIDNSKPDPRNIMPTRMPRDAARKAAELLAGRRVSKYDSDSSSESSSSESSSGIETDEAFDDEDEDRISITENNTVRTLHIHPLKEKVITGPDLLHLNSSNDKELELSSTESEYSHEEVDKKEQIKQGNQKKAADKVAEEKKELFSNSLGKVTETAIEASNAPSSDEFSKRPNEREMNATEKLVTKRTNSPSDEPGPTRKTNIKESNSKKTNVPEKKKNIANSGAVDNSNSSSKVVDKAVRNITNRNTKAKSNKESQTGVAEPSGSQLQKETKFRNDRDVNFRKTMEEEQNGSTNVSNNINDGTKNETERAEINSKTTNKRQDSDALGTSGTKKAKEEEALKSSPIKGPEENQKLMELKAKFTKARTYVPAGLVSQKISRSESTSSDETESSDEDSSSAYSSSSSDEDTSTKTKKIKRLIVDTPKGSLNSKGRRTYDNKLSEVENAPQSTQKESSNQATPNKVPITKLINVSSPISANSGSQKNSTLFQGLPPKVRPSLSSLSDLASRGVPEVREKDHQPSQTSTKDLERQKSERPEANLDSDSESESESESESDSASESDSESADSDSDSSSSSDRHSFISAKSASSALGKKKKNGGVFASLIKDSKRK